jgi:hypothetical protein
VPVVLVQNDASVSTSPDVTGETAPRAGKVELGGTPYPDREQGTL